ncbi:MAG: hypothetical protein U0892_20820 [Pirellulales bacterium]
MSTTLDSTVGDPATEVKVITHGELIIGDPVPATKEVTFAVTDSKIAELKAELTGLSAETKEGYERVRDAIGLVRKARYAIDHRRKELKADALAWGRKVEAEANRLTALLVAIENPLVDEKKRIDDAKAQEKAEREAEARRKKENEERQLREAEETRLRLIHEANERKLAKEREQLAAERQRLADEAASAASRAGPHRSRAES